MKMSKFYLTVFAVIASVGMHMAQVTNPSPYLLSNGNWTLTGWNSAVPSGSYPGNGATGADVTTGVVAGIASANMTFQWFANEQTAVPTGNAGSDYACPYNLGSRPRVNGVGANGFAFINTGSSQFNDCNSGAASNKFTGAALLALNTTGMQNIQVSWTGGTITVSDGTPIPRSYTIQLQYRVGVSGSFTNLSSSYTTGTAGSSSAIPAVTLPAACENAAVVHLRWVYYQNNAGSGTRPQMRVDEILVSGSPLASPGLNVAPLTLSCFQSLQGVASSSQFFDLSGTSLTPASGNITVTPPPGFQVSDDNITFSSLPINIPYSGGALSSTPIYIRLSSSAPLGTNTGNVVCSGGGATDVQVAVTGSVGLLPTVVINEGFNTNLNTEWYELLTIQNNLNMQGYIFRDYSGGLPNAGITFENHPLWASIPAGTLITILQPGNPAAEDFDISDGNVTVSACNTTYFSQASVPCSTNPIAMNATGDILQILNSSSQIIHTLEYSNTTQNCNIPMPKGFLSLASGLAGGGESVVFANISATSQFANSSFTARTLTATQGLANDATERVYICTDLRGITTPTTSASGLSTSGIGTNQMTFNWTTNGNGSRRIVVARLSSTTAVPPTNGVVYTANTAFGTICGTCSTGVGNFVVYDNNSPNTVIVTALSANTDYDFDIYEYNGLGECTNYRTISATLANQQTLSGNSITTTPISGSPFCVSPTSLSANFNVDYTILGTYNAGNVFTAQLSDASGNFSAPTTIGTVTSVTPVTISATVPAGTTPGSGYQVRVISDNPATIGTPQPITINAAPVNVTGQAATPGNSQVTVSWTNPVPMGCWDEIMIVAKASAFTSAVPSGNAYVHNSNNFTNGLNSTFDGGVVVYKGTASPQIITGLTNNTNYNFKIFTRAGNDWSNGVVVSATPTLVINIGDVQILSYNSTDPDGWAFVTWIDLPGSTVLRFTDNGFLNAGQPSTATNNFRGTEGHVTWTAPASGLRAGSVVTITLSPLATSDGTLVAPTAPNLSTSGDQLFIYTGPILPNANPTTFTGNIIYGINFGGNWSAVNTNSTNTSCLPTDLNVPGGNRQFTQTNGRYTASRNNQNNYAAFKTMVEDNSNWTLANGVNTPLDGTDFTPISTWLGTINTDWNNPGNWNFNFVPTNNTHVIIPDQTNDPVVSATSTCLDMTINSGAVVTVNGANTLTVNGNYTGAQNSFSGTGNVILAAATGTISGGGNFTNLQINGNYTIPTGAANMVNVSGGLAIGTGFTLTSNNNVTLKSTNSGTGYLDVFSAGNTGTYNGDITVERYIAGASGFRFLGSPVNTPSVNVWGAVSGGANGAYVTPDPGNCDSLLNGSPYANMMQYDESVVTSCRMQGWQLKTAGNLVDGRGYAFIVPVSNDIISASGTPNNGPKTFTGLTSSASPAVLTNGNQVKGTNMISNPYPSPIDWGALRASNTHLGIAAYLYNQGTWVTLFGAGNIASSQGFQVIYDGIGPNTVSFNNSHRVAESNTSFYQTPNLQHQLEIVVNGNGQTDQTVVYFDNNATIGWDLGYDAYKMGNDQGFISLSTGITGATTKLSYNGMPMPTSQTQIPMGMNPAGAGSYTFDFQSIESLPLGMLVYLEDLKTNTIQLLNQNSSYTFEVVSGENQDRFRLIFTAPLAVETISASCAATGQISISNPGIESWIYTVNGQGVIQNGTLTANTVISNLPAGNYQLILSHSSGYHTQKSITIDGFDIAVANVVDDELFVQLGNSIQFNNSSTNANNFVWNFGDGNTSIEQYPIHTYTSEGSYMVTLFATNGNCSDTDTLYVKVANLSAGFDYLSHAAMQVYNASNTLIIENKSAALNQADLKVLDLNGKVLFELSSTKFNTGQSIITLPELSSGVYLVKITAGEFVKTQKLIFGVR
jgi:hypothetical protein